MNTSPVMPKPQPETFDFPKAIQQILDGKKVTKLEWDNPDDFILLRDGMLQIHRGNKFHNLLVSEGDMVGTDWVVTEHQASQG